MEDINDHGGLPPQGLFTPLQYDWYGSCIENVTDPTEAGVAAVVASHGSSGSVLGEFGVLVPLLDNYHYNQRQAGNRPLGEQHRNAKSVVQMGESVRLVATRKIVEGEQIYRAFENKKDLIVGDLLDFETGGVFRDYGIVDTEIYPKYYYFRIMTEHEEDESIGVFLDTTKSTDDDDDNKSLKLHWVIGDYDTEEYDWVEIEIYMTRELNRLQRIQAVASTEGSTSAPPADSNMSLYEWETAWKYHANLLEVVTLAVDEIGKKFTEESCPGGMMPSDDGVCPIWDGFDDLPTVPITDLNLEFDPSNPYGPSDTGYNMCNDEDASAFENYIPAGDEAVIKSQYQEIRFYSDATKKDMVMKLDATVQQCSSYRPHYHEFAVHYPARFIETIKRVLFVGGGDSMVLHEVLKYPSLELVVGLELDQYVVRNSFRYFNSQPHFDDKRVEWWFGDGAKSLLMLPKEYFQSFDLVVVDLSETVMSFQVTDKLSIFQTLSLLLKPEGIMLKNGEYYMDKMSQYFDYTLQYFEYDVPFICDQGMVIGSNNIDFFNRTMKDHGVELLVYESQDEINEKFNEYYRFTEYRKNDARKQDKCEDMDDDIDMERRNAGILMIVEAENLTHEFKSIGSTEGLITQALDKIGLSIITPVTRAPTTIVVLLKEGYVTARLFPEKSYIGFDIQLWGNFYLMDKARDQLVESFGGTEEATSSFRIVTGGMRSTPTQENDRKKIGPRMVNSRNCEEDVPADTTTTVGKSIDLVQGTLEESLHLLEEGAMTAAVLCGAEGETCKSLEVLSKTEKIKKVIPVYTCASLKESSAQFSSDISKKMAECEVEISNTLASDTIDDKISLLVVDDTSQHIMGKPLLGIFTSVWNRKRLFTSNRFVAFSNSSETINAWRRNLLVKIREEVGFKPMSLVDLALEDAESKSKVSILSIHDPEFFLHVKEMVGNFNLAHEAIAGATMEVESVFDGLPPPHIGHFRPKKFEADDYDPNPAKEQHSGQVSLGRQSIIQFEMSPNGGPKFSESILETALKQAIASTEDLEIFFFQDGIGDGMVGVTMSRDGTVDVVITWDGNTHLDVNLFTRDESPQLRQNFIETFTSKLKTVQLTLSDTHPRGTGRVVSFPGHIN